MYEYVPPIIKLPKAFGWPVTNFEKYNLGNAISCKLGIKFFYAVLVTLKDLEIVAAQEHEEKLHVW